MAFFLALKRVRQKEKWLYVDSCINLLRLLRRWFTNWENRKNFYGEAFFPGSGASIFFCSGSFPWRGYVRRILRWVYKNWLRCGARTQQSNGTSAGWRFFFPSSIHTNSPEKKNLADLIQVSIRFFFLFSSFFLVWLDPVEGNATSFSCLNCVKTGGKG